MADRLRKFSGFPPGKLTMTKIPAPFIHDLMPLIDDLAELKLMMFCFWALPQKEGRYVYLRQRDFLNNGPFMAGLAAIDADAEAVLAAALERAVARGGLLRAVVQLPQGDETLYFVNTPRGREAVEQVLAGKWQPGDSNDPVEILPERPNIYQMYENNIGPLTPMIAEDLKDTEEEFPAEWIEAAMRIAVQNNARNLRYIRAILERWRTEGRDDTAKQEDQVTDGSIYISGKYGKYIEH